jgi:signal peptidase I
LLEGDHLFVNKFIYGLRVPYTGAGGAVSGGSTGRCRGVSVSGRVQGNAHYGKDFIKRAIALPGDTVEIRDKKVFVNGQEQVEPFAQFEDDYLIPPVQDLLAIPIGFKNCGRRAIATAPGGENHSGQFRPGGGPARTYFVMGDNRDRSFDGRFWGPMPDSNLKGKAWLLYLPFRRWKIIR